MPPVSISHDGFLRIVTSLTRPVSLPGGNRTKAPLAKGGCLGLPRRGDKRLAGFHMGLFYRKVPTVNPSVTATPCQLPLAREPFCARYRYFAEGLVSYLPPVGSYGVRWGKRGPLQNFCNGLVLFIPFSGPFPSPLPGSRAGQNHLPPAGAA